MGEVVGQGLARVGRRPTFRHVRWLLALVSSTLLLQVVAQPAALAQGAGQTAPAVPGQAAAALPSAYWGSFIQGWPGDPAVLDSFEQVSGKGESIVAWGEAWYHNNGYLGFPTQHVEAVRARGSIPLVNWASWDYCCGVDQPDFSLASIVRGDHDPFLVHYAQRAASWGHPFFLVFDSEMNGWWWPWSEQINGNNPGEFVAAWRHVHDIFVQQHATNATWVWCPNIVEPAATPLAQLYPGDNYVDWTCMDGYNWSDVRGSPWQEPAQVFGASDYRGESSSFNSNTYALLRQIAPSKPIMIAETATPEAGGSKPDWITDFYTQTLPSQFPSIKAVVWFGWFDKDLQQDWSVNSSPEAAAAFANAVALPRYASNIYKSLANSPIQPPDGPYTGT